MAKSNPKIVEMPRDPRALKHFRGMTTSKYALERAFLQGQQASRPRNPYHAGRRHDEWARGYETNPAAVRQTPLAPVKPPPLRRSRTLARA